MIFDESAPLAVGIGASAGGLSAFKQFFGNMPVDNGMAFILIQHLDPHHDSLLVDLIGKQTAMKVVEVSDGVQLRANTVFIIPPDATLTISGGALHLTKPAPPRELRRPIDTFFASLAADQGANAVCIVLSGLGSDGTLGLKAVKECGGLTLAQAETGHQPMSGMPDSAAASGLVDQVLMVEAMPAHLMTHRARLIGDSKRDNANGFSADTAEHLKTIAAILQRSVSHDFGQYKQSTLIRRVQRRMQILQIGGIPAFIEHLQKEPGEADLLFREIMIGVTEFFRDPLAFDALRTMVIPKLLENKGKGDHIRIWAPGCATGEEVYSIAILLNEAMADLKKNPPHVQIFGSDIDDRAVAHARAANYRDPIQGVSPERLNRWFTADKLSHSVIRSVREMCMFSTHSLIKDPPFSKLNLISCRNVMIYFDPDLQDRIIRSFHYALAPGGYLFMGSAEGITRSATLFATIDKRHRIHEWRSSPRTVLPDIPSMRAPHRRQVASGPSRSVEDRIERSAQRIMAKYSPAYVVIDQNSQIVRFSGGEVGQYLEPSAGIASLDLFAILQKTLRAAVRAAVRSARSKRETVVAGNLTVTFEGSRRLLDVIVEPIVDDSAEAGLCVVTFRDAGRGSNKSVARSPAAKHGTPEVSSTASDLEHELTATQELLRVAIDDLETTTEEMRSSNEEYQSVNEELQAANEELETAKEEMQSVNEELRAINAEVADKNTLLMRLNSDLRNLLESTQISTIFLDNDLRIKSFTPGMADLIHLRESDQGRPLAELVSLLNYAGLVDDARTVLTTLGVIEREVSILDDDCVFIMRIRPYRTVTNVIDGVVITFVDVTARTQLEVALKESERRLAAIVNQATVGVAEVDLDERFTLVNPQFCFIAGRAEKELSGLRMQDITHAGDLQESAVKFERLKAKCEGFELETRLIRPDGSPVWVHSNVSPIIDAKGHVRRALAVVTDTTEVKRAEAHRELLLHELSHRVKNILSTVQAIAAQTAIGASTVDAYRRTFTARLMALSATHNLLQIGDWHGALLRDVVLSEIAPFQTEAVRWTIDGPDFLLAPDAALAFGMVIHELAANAAKYGALSNSDGQVDISWSVRAQTGGRALNFAWCETGGPTVNPSPSKGFGTRLITEGLMLQLDADVELEFNPAGVRCAIDVLLPPVGTGK